MKKEIHLLNKELIDKQLKTRVLEDNLEKPLNVHRWRKLECTQPEKFEMIQKIQSLQKRLIAKSEEVAEKDVLIQEKEKLYVELKNILAKQAGPAVTEKLGKHENKLKQWKKEYKDIEDEIAKTQSKVNEYQFEIERIDQQILKLKKYWFQA